MGPQSVADQRLKQQQRKKGSAITRGALMLWVNSYLSVITGTAPADSGTRPDTV